MTIDDEIDYVKAVEGAKAAKQKKMTGRGGRLDGTKGLSEELEDEK